MFKKPPQPKASANNKSSERRKLLASIAKTYGLSLDSLSKENQQLLLSPTTKQASFKSEQGVSGTIYYDERENPIWFKDRDSQLMPSVFTCWRAGGWLPTITTHPHVIGVLQNGADLMLPGTVPPFDSRATKGQVVGIVDSAHPSVVKAVGVTKLNMTQFDRVIGRSGVAVEIIHVMGDELCQLAKDDFEVPDSVESIVGDEGVDQMASLDIGDDTEVSEVATEATEPETAETAEVTEATGSETTEEPTETVADTPEEPTLSTEDLDKFFIRSLMQTIKTTDIELPISASTFMSQHIYKNLPAIDSSYANVKKTSWKKTAKYLKAMDKAGYLATKGKDDDLSVVKLMPRSDPKIETFVTHRTLAQAQATPAGPTPSKKANELTVKNWYKPTGNLRGIYNASADGQYQKLATAPQVRAVLDTYIKQKSLIDPKNPKLIRIDDGLRLGTGIKQESATRDVVQKSFLAAHSPHCEIIKPGAEHGDVYKGSPPKIQVLTETKIGRKTVTKVTEFERFFIKPTALADELKAKCQGSATIHECVQNPKLQEVQIQGPHGPAIVELLKSKGVPVSFIKFEDKSRKKRKR
ncbi:hypothetical protein DICA3_E01046 [Diutina catenulata]